MDYIYSKTFNAKRRLNAGTQFVCQCGWRGRIQTCKEVYLDADAPRPQHVIYLCPHSYHILGESRDDGGPVGMLDVVQGPAPIEDRDYTALATRLDCSLTFLECDATLRGMSERPLWRADLEIARKILDDLRLKALAQASKMRSGSDGLHDTSPNETT